MKFSVALLSFTLYGVAGLVQATPIPTSLSMVGLPREAAGLPVNVLEARTLPGDETHSANEGEDAPHAAGTGPTQTTQEGHTHEEEGPRNVVEAHRHIASKVKHSRMLDNMAGMHMMMAGGLPDGDVKVALIAGAQAAMDQSDANHVNAAKVAKKFGIPFHP